jgi:hypothetical protein
MRVFLSYAAEYRALAEDVALRLSASDIGHRVFFDRKDLPPAASFDDRIRRAILASDVLVFLLSPEAIARGSYALTEMEIARSKWPHPEGHVLVVRVAEVPLDSVPPYLRAATILDHPGNVPAGILHVLETLRRPWLPSRRVLLVCSVALLALLGGAAWRHWSRPPDVPTAETAAEGPQGLDVRPLPEALRHRARLAVSGGDGMTMALADPTEIVRLDKDGGVSARRPLPGGRRALAMATARDVLYVATGTVDSNVLELDGRTLDERGTSPAIPDDALDPWGAHVSPVPTSLAATGSELWVVTGGSQGEAGLFSCDSQRLSQCHWHRPAYTTDASGTLSSVRDLSLAAGPPVWAITSGTTPSSLYRLADDRVIEFGGHEFESVSCAWGLAVTPSGNPLLVSCDQELTGLESTDSRIKVMLSVPLGIVNDDGPGRWITHHLATTSNGTVYVGVTTLSNATTPFTAIRARVVRTGLALDKASGGSHDTRLVFELSGAEIVALAASDTGGVVVVRSGDRFDAYRVGGGG